MENDPGGFCWAAHAHAHSRNAENGERQERPCIRRSISCPPCRLASYLLNETVPTDLDNRALASVRPSLHRERSAVSQRVPVPELSGTDSLGPGSGWMWGSRIIGSFRCCHSFSSRWRFFSFFLFHSPPGPSLVTGTTLTRHHEWFAPEWRFISHFPTHHLFWMCGCDSCSRWLILGPWLWSCD